MPRLLLTVLLLGACRAAPDVLRGYAPVNDTVLYYELSGSGPPLVLLQGAQLGLEMWDEQFERFARSYRVLRLDVRGFGKSGPEGDSFQHHEDVHGLMRFLGIERAHLVGLSLGGRIAVDLALTHPDSVGAMVLSGPGVSGWEWVEDGSFDEIRAAIEARDHERVADAWLRHPYVEPSLRVPGLDERLRELALANVASWMQERSEAPLDPPALERLGEVRAPTLVLIGTHDVDDIQRIVDLLIAGIPGARRVDFEGGGHILNLEAPRRFEREVLRFLARHELERTSP